jgi:hypothetical protein
MRKKDVQIGETYIVKVSGNLVPVRLTGESRYGGWDGINTKTKRSVRIKTAARLRRPARPTKPVSPSDANRPGPSKAPAKELISESDRLLNIRPWELWEGTRCLNTETGEEYIATSSRSWMYRLEIWRSVVRRFADICNCPCPSPMPEGHIMFEDKLEQYKVIA